MGVTMRMTDGKRPELPDDYDELSFEERKPFDEVLLRFDKEKSFFVDYETLEPTKDLKRGLSFSYTSLYLAFIRYVALFDSEYAIKKLCHTKVKGYNTDDDYVELVSFLNSYVPAVPSFTMYLLGIGECNGELSPTYMKCMLADNDYIAFMKHIDSDIQHKSITVSGVETSTDELNSKTVKETLMQFLGACRIASDRGYYLMWS